MTTEPIHPIGCDCQRCDRGPIRAAALLVMLPIVAIAALVLAKALR